MKECGKIYGSKLKDILTAQKEDKWEIKNNKLYIADVELDDNLFNVVYKTKNGVKAMQCKNFNLLVMIDTELTHELIIEGLSRDIVRIVQQTRKNNNYDISDKINIVFYTTDAIYNEVLSIWNDYICNQTLAETIKIENKIDDNNCFDVDGHKFSIFISKSLK